MFYYKYSHNYAENIIITKTLHNVCTGVTVTCIVRMFISFATVSPTLLLLNLPVSFDSSLKLKW